MRVGIALAALLVALSACGDDAPERARRGGARRWSRTDGRGAPRDGDDRLLRIAPG